MAKAISNPIQVYNNNNKKKKNNNNENNNNENAKLYKKNIEQENQNQV